MIVRIHHNKGFISAPSRVIICVILFLIIIYKHASFLLQETVYCKFEVFHKLDSESQRFSNEIRILFINELSK